MKKIQIGKIVSVKMGNTVVVEVTRRVTHPLYKKILKRSKKYKVDSSEITPVLGDSVKIVSTKPISKEKHFKILEVKK
ncbi:MAG: 30S ribosomal protein S17 [Candidatus Levybacteria bacterium RBG_13_35_9]|nr:MAG: 30S ribosomal protein S17 [Candidatus Levybacteria bacterium RBG_13_35_9]